jgi:hypothetical protein
MTVLYFTQLKERPDPNIASIMMHGHCLGTTFMFSNSLSKCQVEIFN